MTTNKYFKQVEYVENLIKKRKWDGSVKSDFKSIAKYLYHKGFNTQESIYNELKRLCEQKGSGWFNEVRDYKYLDKHAKDALKENNPIIQINSVVVTEVEWEFINGLPQLDMREKKVLFGMLIHARLKNIRQAIQNQGEIKSLYYFGGNSTFSFKQLLDSLNDKYTRTFLDKDIYLMVHKFNNLGLTKSHRNLSVELLFMEELSVQLSPMKFEILDFDNIGLYWDYEHGDKKVKKCAECNERLIKLNNNKNKYCIDCYNTHRREYVKNKVKEFRCKQIENSQTPCPPTVSSIDDKSVI